MSPAHGFVVSADGVTIRHLKVEGAGAPASVGSVSGDNATIEDVEVSDWSHGHHPGPDDGTTVQDSDIHDNA